MPVLDTIWLIFLGFLFIAWIFVVVSILADIFRSHDLGGLAKAAWIVFIIFFTWLGVIAYLIVHGKDMTARYRQNREDRNTRRSYTASGFSSSKSLETWRSDAGLVFGRVD